MYTVGEGHATGAGKSAVSSASAATGRRAAAGDGGSVDRETQRRGRSQRAAAHLELAAAAAVSPKSGHQHVSRPRTQGRPQHRKQSLWPADRYRGPQKTRVMHLFGQT